MTVVMAFLAGMLIGSAIGIITMALCVAAGMEAGKNYKEDKDENSD